ncbi:MAG TPA: acyloxyacyl hydrolase [Verrucomicrobiae bacterium]
MKTQQAVAINPVAAVLLGVCVGTALSSAAAAQLEESFGSSSGSVWQSDVGQGFRKGANEFSMSLGFGLGVAAFGGRERHDWGLGFADYGWMLSGVVAKDHWYRGNWELLRDLFGGFQYYPDHAFVVGAAPILRYNLATGTRWVPFFSLGGGVVGTDIRDGDLSTKFEFNLQGGPGVHYFLKENLSLTFQYRFIHISNAGLSSPNLGVNSNTLMAGLTWFF